MLSTLAIVLVAWAVMVPAVLGVARLLGRLSALPARGAVAVEAPPAAEDNVVALVPRPRNGLSRGERLLEAS